MCLFSNFTHLFKHAAIKGTRWYWWFFSFARHRRCSVDSLSVTVISETNSIHTVSSIKSLQPSYNNSHHGNGSSAIASQLSISIAAATAAIKQHDLHTANVNTKDNSEIMKSEDVPYSAAFGGSKFAYWNHCVAVIKSIDSTINIINIRPIVM